MLLISLETASIGGTIVVMQFDKTIYHVVQSHRRYLVDTYNVFVCQCMIVYRNTKV